MNNTADLDNAELDLNMNDRILESMYYEAMETLARIYDTYRYSFESKYTLFNGEIPLMWKDVPILLSEGGIQFTIITEDQKLEHLVKICNDEPLLKVIRSIRIPERVA